MTVFGDGGLRGGIRLNGVRRVGFHLVLRISVLVRKEIRELVLSPHTHTTERPCEHTMRRELSKARKQAFTRHWMCQPLDLGFLSLQNYEK